MQARTRRLMLNLASGLAVAVTTAMVFTPALVQAAPATTTANVNLRSGPGPNFSVVGQVQRGENVDVAECRSGFCYIQRPGPDGWVSADFLRAPGARGPGFGIQIGPGGVQIGIGPGGGNPPPGRPGGPGGGPGWGGPGPGGPGGGPGWAGPGWNGPGGPRPREACFYEDPNFGGRHFCVERGDSVRNLARMGNWNDRISSIDNEDGLAVEVCIDSEFRSLCRTYTTSAGFVGPVLNDKISSIRVR